MTECFADKWHPARPQCQEPAVWQSAGLGNLVDDWTWCSFHSPSPSYRIALHPTRALGVPDVAEEEEKHAHHQSKLETALDVDEDCDPVAEPPFGDDDYDHLEESE